MPSRFCKTHHRKIVTYFKTLTFSEAALVRGLTMSKNGLDKDPHVSLGRVAASDHRKAEAFSTWALFEGDIDQLRMLGL